MSATAVNPVQNPQFDRAAKAKKRCNSASDESDSEGMTFNASTVHSPRTIRGESSEV